MVPMKSLLLGLVLQTQSFIVPVQAFIASNNINNSYLSSSVSLLSISPNKMSSTSTALDMARNRGLERREEGATPLRKSILYIHMMCVIVLCSCNGIVRCSILCFRRIKLTRFCTPTFSTLCVCIYYHHTSYFFVSRRNDTLR